MKTHVSINVNNVAESVEFYKKMFGADPFKVRDDYAKFDISNPPLNLTMNEVQYAHGGSLSHLGLQVESTDEVLAIGKRWAENGLITLAEMQTSCCYALQDKTWVTDPDGNKWEVFVVLDNSADTNIASSACCISDAQPVSIARAS
ncbi:MAG: ArsI/CadI family heavy metal resistance metalloenzyme [Pyrinomonadaceae bacterium]